ncbi:MAG: ParB N-terminal domain-containing protein [Spirochaetales bacterium]|nr:ParB N-terminal domain-containing protein [Spirochaetales bacterium]
MQLPVDSIRIRKRVRKELGDITALVNSLRKYGQLSPILIDPDYELIAGFRRLQAAKRLGWRSVEVIIVDTDSDVQKLEIELEENIQRRNLSPDEISDGINIIHKLLNPGIFMRIINFFKRLFRRLFKKRRR